MQECRAWMRRIRARPLNAAERFEPRVAHPPGELRRDSTEFVPDVFGRRHSPIMAQTLRDLRNDPQLVLRTLRRIHRLAHSLYAPLGIGDRAFTLAPRRGRGQDHVRELRRAREKDLLYDEMIQPRERGLDMARVRV